MRLLYVTDQVPSIEPVHGNGSSLISYELINAFSADIEISLLTFAGSSDVPEPTRQRVRTINFLPTRPLPVALGVAALRRTNIQAEQLTTLAGLKTFNRCQEETDVTLLQGNYVLNYAMRVSRPTLFQVIDPVSMTLKMQAQGSASGLMAAYRREKQKKALRQERRFSSRLSLATVNVDEAATWSKLLQRDVLAIPNGVRPIAARGADARTDPTICFLGSLNYLPNVDSATQLVEVIAKEVWKVLPSTRFLIAGRTPTREVVDLAGPLVEVMANVPDVADVFARSDLAVFPDRLGTGTRNSVSEALAAGVPVVASEVAARGQEANIGLHVPTSPDGLAALVIEQLQAALRNRGSGIPAVSAPSRTWAVAAGEYEDELRRLAGLGQPVSR